MGKKLEEKACTSLSQLGNEVISYLEGKSYSRVYRREDYTHYCGSLRFECETASARVVLETIKGHSYTTKIIHYLSTKGNLKGKFSVVNATTYHGGKVRLHSDHHQSPDLDEILEMTKDIDGVKYLYSVEDDREIIEGVRGDYLGARDLFRYTLIHEIAGLEGISTNNNGSKNHKSNRYSKIMRAAQQKAHS